MSRLGRARPVFFKLFLFTCSKHRKKSSRSSRTQRTVPDFTSKNIRNNQGLKISIDELISSPRADCKHIKASDVPIDRRSKNGVTLRKLLPDKIPSTEMDELHLEPGATMTGSPHVEGTREYFTRISGQLSIGVLGEIHHLEKADVLAFPGDKPHSYKNTGRTTAVGVSVVFFAVERF